VHAIACLVTQSLRRRENRRAGCWGLECHVQGKVLKVRTWAVTQLTAGLGQEFLSLSLQYIGT